MAGLISTGQDANRRPRRIEGGPMQEVVAWLEDYRTFWERRYEALAELLGQDEAKVLRRLSERRGFVYLARALPAAAAQQVLGLKLPGIAGTPVMRLLGP